VLEGYRRVEIKLHLFLPLMTEANSEYYSLTASTLQKELPDELRECLEQMEKRMFLLLPGTDLGPPGLTQSFRRTPRFSEIY
jgi:hypothetical protein